MPSMSFIPELKAFLRERKVIYTVRKYKMGLAVVEVDGIGKCKRIPIGLIKSKDELGDYVRLSGFSSVDAWWAKIKYFIPNSTDTKYIYKVEILE